MKTHSERYTMRKQQSKPQQSYRFKRVLKEILDFMNGIPTKEDFQKCKTQFDQQLEELTSKGYTWGYEYAIPVHDSDFNSLSRREWHSIRSIVSKQDRV